jgi:hypothetical protein
MERVIGKLSVGRDVHSHRGVAAQQDGVAIRWRRLQRPDGDGTTGSSFVFHYDRLPDTVSQLLPKIASIYIGATTWPEGNDDPHRL